MTSFGSAGTNDEMKNLSACYERALKLAQTVEPQLQTSWVPVLKGKLGRK